MSGGKIVALILGAGVVAVAALVAVVFLVTSPLVDLADAFLKDLSQGDTASAYEKTSAAFQNGTTQEQLAAYAEKLGLADLQEASWGSRSMKAGTGAPGHLSGSLTLRDGSEVPLAIDFVEQEGQWRVHYLSSQVAGLQQEGGEAEVLPNEAESVALVHDTMTIFARAVAAGSMQTLHAHASIPFKTQFSEARFDEIYGAFYPLGDALLVIERMSPAFDEAPYLDEEGLLTVKGIYPTNPDRVHFETSYVREGLGWKLIGLNVNIAP